jgi:4-hydroxyphenylpyruvate dioxygenase
MSKEIKNVDYGLEKIFEGAQDFLPLLGTDYVEFYIASTTGALVYGDNYANFCSGVWIRS